MKKRLKCGESKTEIYLQNQDNKLEVKTHKGGKLKALRRLIKQINDLKRFHLKVKRRRQKLSYSESHGAHLMQMLQVDGRIDLRLHIQETR
jgi:RNase P/RNase MRP subunit p30